MSTIHPYICTGNARAAIDWYVQAMGAVEVPSRAALRDAIVGGRASVGIEIPPDYARRRVNGQPADILVLITKITDEMPREEDVDRISALLAAHGWPIAGIGRDDSA